MRMSLITVGVLVTAAFNSAWIAEGANNNCAAVERLAMRLTTEKGTSPGMLVKGFIALSDGRLAAGMASDKLPHLPTPVACAITYWNGSISDIQKKAATAN